MQLQLVKGRLVKACMCSCKGCNEQQREDSLDDEGAPGMTPGEDQQQQAEGATAEQPHKLEPRLRALVDLRTVNMELDAKGQSR